MRRQTQFTLVAGAALALVLVVLLLVNRSGDGDGPAVVDTAEETSLLVREDSHVLGEEGSGDVTFVEFLDFECEACGAAYPIVEQLREDYAGQVTFVARYFPLPNHTNAMPAARAVESAARQGKFEEMYQKMYETQSAWGEQQTVLDGLFRQYAEELGLDMAQYDADYASEEVAARVQRDIDDGTALNITGTPTFFVNGEPFQPQSVEDFNRVLDEALAG